MKLKLKNFQVLQHSKCFKQPFYTSDQLLNGITLLLNEMHITAQQQFRLVGVGVYQLCTQQPQSQLDFWY